MSEVFFISDLHLGQRNILTFNRDDGSRLRPFKDLDEMHDAIINGWNSVVQNGDKVYVLGDVAFNKNSLRLLEEMKGSKRLVKGNHDLFKIRLYLEYFKEVYGVRQINGVWLTHVPMHTQSVYSDRVLGNVHGHLHGKPVIRNTTVLKPAMPDPKYINASVESLDYVPISMTEVEEKFKDG